VDSSHEGVQGDDAWDRRARDETPVERLDRNWGDLVQELRVVQTGVQFLTGFLLTLPFQQKFATLSDGQVALYLATVSCAVAATAFLQSPVSVHRALFRRHQRATTVAIAHRLSIVGVVFFAGAVVGVAALTFDVTVGLTAAVIAAIVVAAGLIGLWLVVPLALRGPKPEPDEQVPDSS
jgi:O-antigen/teichoic acid export membrane protein